MARKVFLSFLGAIKYDPTEYTIGVDYHSPLTCFAQEAIIRCQGKFDKIFIFTTKDAELNNYHNRNVGFGKSLLPHDGLENVLNKLREEKIIDHFENLLIPEGYASAEIWEVFQIVLNVLEEGDEVTLDITYGFRSLPMLGLVLLHYAKVLRAINVEAIWYGAFEAGREERDTKRKAAIANGMEKEDAEATIHCIAPILDLKSFAELQEWINAVQTFDVAGDPNLLARLMHNAGATEQANELCVLFDALRSVRGRLLTTQDIDIQRVKSTFEDNIHPDIAPFVVPIIEKVKQKIAPFAAEKLENGFAAVQWCIDNNLVQQGYTFLQETTKSYVVWKALNDLGLAYDDQHRECANGALGTTKPHHQLRINYNGDTATPDMKPITDFARSKRSLCVAYKKLIGHEGMRNDINHGGYKQGYASAVELKRDLVDIFSTIKSELL